MKFSFDQARRTLNSAFWFNLFRRITGRMGPVKTAVCLLIVLTAVTFLPSLNNGFVNWDDDIYVINNVLVKDLSMSNIKTIFLSFYSSNYQPLVHLTFALEYRLFGLTPFFYHLTNLLLHVVNTLLVFFFILLLAGELPVALGTALLFGIHPLHVESVAWISQRKDVLYAAFFLGALICYGYHCRERGFGRWYFFAFCLFIGALLSKGMAVTLPLVFCLVDYYLSRSSGGLRWLEKIPFFVLAIFFGVLSAIGQRRAEIFQDLNFSGWPQKIAHAGYGIFFYISKLFYPVELSCLYPYTRQQRFDSVLFYVAICLVLFGSVFFLFREKKRVVFGTLFFLTSLLPVLQFVSLGEIIVADRYAYISSIGIFFIVVSIGVSLWSAVRFKAMKVLLIVFGMCVTVALSLLTWNRCMVWKDGLTLWSDVLKKYPQDVTAYHNRGIVYLERGDYEKSRADLDRNRGLYSGYARRDSNVDKVFYYLGLSAAYNREGLYGAAEAVLREAISTDPDDARYYYVNLAVSCAGLGKKTEAIDLLNYLIIHDFSVAHAYYNLGLIYKNAGQNREAVAMWEKAVEADPGMAEAYYGLGVVAQDDADMKRALSLFQKVIRLVPTHKEALNDLGVIYNAMGRHKEAILCARKIIALDPGYSAAYGILGNAHYSLGKNDLALMFFNKAIELAPDSAVAYNNAALVCYDMKKYDSAIMFFDKAAGLGYPVDPEVYERCKPV